jgi:CRISPR-associated protein Csh2
MSNSFNNRVFGCVIIKALNANYNADFSHRPRTLPDGTVYATDKALKYTVRNYLAKNFKDEKIFYFKSLNEEMQPRDLDESYVKYFGEFPKTDKKESLKTRKTILANLLTCIDVRLFGGTFASKDANLSLHGTTQITHGVNRFGESIIYSEQISSPFRNSNSTDSMQTTLGTQFKLKEGHYVHHFSINPRNLEEMCKAADSEGLTNNDVDNLKEALKNGATFYDSSAKAGVENELLFWVQLKEDSKLVLPSFVELVSVANNEKREIDFAKVTALLDKETVKSEIQKIEIFYNTATTTVLNLPPSIVKFELN